MLAIKLSVDALTIDAAEADYSSNIFDFLFASALLLQKSIIQRLTDSVPAPNRASIVCPEVF